MTPSTIKDLFNKSNSTINNTHISSPLPNEEFLIPLTINENKTHRRRTRRYKKHKTYRVYKRNKKTTKSNRKSSTYKRIRL